VGLAGSGGGARVAVQALAQVLALLVGHHGELEVDARHALERGDGAVDAALDLVAQRAPRHGEGDQDTDAAVGADVDRAQHAEVDDRAVQLGVLHGAQCVDDLVVGDGHARSLSRRASICTTRIVESLG
jgi:hypothetical protein